MDLTAEDALNVVILNIKEYIFNRAWDDELWRDFSYADGFNVFFTLLPFCDKYMRIYLESGDGIVCVTCGFETHVYFETGSLAGMSINVVDFIERCFEGFVHLEKRLEDEKKTFMIGLLYENRLERSEGPDLMALVLNYPLYVEFCGKKYSYTLMEESMNQSNIRGLTFSPHDTCRSEDCIRVPIRCTNDALEVYV